MTELLERPDGTTADQPGRQPALPRGRRAKVVCTLGPATASEQKILTYGIQFRPVSQTVIKADYQDVDNEAGTGLDQWNIGIGYIF